MSAPRAALAAGLLWLAAGGLALAQAQPSEQPKDQPKDQPSPSPAGEPVSLRPRYGPGLEREVETRLSIVLSLQLSLPSVGLERTSEQEQVALRHLREQVVEAASGEPRRVRRLYLDAWDGERAPGARSLTRTVSPLSGQKVEVWWDERARRRRARSPGDALPLPRELLAEERLRERWDVALPREPVRVGEAWKLGKDELREALGPRLAQQGQLRCRLEAVRREELDPQTPAEDYAVVALELEAEAEGEGGAKIRSRLKGQLRVSLQRRQVTTLELRGTARLESVREEDGHRLTISGEGPLELRKRAWFPRRPPPERR
ncbi:MAG: hypothetical protein AB7N76_20455 [Planctomycetota bacterium]